MIYHITIVIVSLFSMSNCQSSTLTFFTRDAICLVTSKSGKSCSKEVPAAGSLMQCVRLCSRDDSCIGANLDDRGKCFLKQQCYDNPICTEEESNPRYVSRYCVNGTWDFSSQSCKCAYGFHGDRCEHYPRSCHDLTTSGYTTGWYRIYVDPVEDGKNPVLPECFISQNSDITFTTVFRNEGQHAFNRSWDEFVKGYYIDKGHHWAGLHALHVISTTSCGRLLVNLQSTLTWKLYRQYLKFRVSSGSNKYAFTFKSTHTEKRGTPPPGTYIGDCFTPLKNTPFSTWDNDHDGDDQENCASRAGSGWWYSGCNNPCNAFTLGFDNRDNKPSHQLFSVPGVDTDQFPPYIEYVSMNFKC